MSKTLNSAAVGELARRARMAAGLSQTELGQRIGASRFWVAQFEKGKPSAELGLALRALHALGLTIHIEPKDASQRSQSRQSRQSRKAAAKTLPVQTDLGRVIAHATLTKAAPSSVIGWPTVSTPSGRSRKP